MAQVIFEFEVLFLEALQASLLCFIRNEVDLIHVRIAPKVQALLSLLPMDLVLANRIQVVLSLAMVLRFPIDFIVLRFP